jgi:hypothetical protein
MRAQTRDQQHNFVSARAPRRDISPRRRAHTPAPPRRLRPRPGRPRQPTVQGRAFPTRPHPEAPWSPPGPRAAICPRRTGRACATDRRSVSGVPPYARRSRLPDHGRIFAVTPSSSPVEFPYLRPRSTLARTTIATAAAMTAA